jgi:pyruvate/2-oxoglutarate/acetoin dehydrogenase E1 component
MECNPVIHTLCVQAADLAAKEGVECEIIDLRTLLPWDFKTVEESVKRMKTHRIT